MQFNVDGLVAVRLTTPPARDATSQTLWEFERRVFQQLEGLPAIASVAAANSLPLERGVNTPMTIAGHPDFTGTVEWRAVTPGSSRRSASRGSQDNRSSPPMRQPGRRSR